MELVSKTEKHLGTMIEIKLPMENSNLFSICFDELHKIEKKYSRFLDDSELCALNGNIGSWQDISDEMMYLLLKAEEFKTKTGGNFDITLKSVLDSMGYDKDYSFKPKPPKTKRLLDYLRQPVQIDRTNSRVLLRTEIEFGGLGKGFALDRIKQLLESNGVKHYYINAGGDIFARKGDRGEPWVVLLEHPYDSSMAIGKVIIDNCSIAGSAPNRRKWGEYHHLINAKTKKPAMGVAAIFVIAKTGIEADAYATALFTAGYNEGKALSRKLPVEILIISSQNKMYCSEGFHAELF